MDTDDARLLKRNSESVPKPDISSSIREPDPELIGKHAKHISESKTLTRELKKIGIDPNVIAYLIAVYHEHENDLTITREERKKTRDRAKDGLKKIRKRHPADEQGKRKKLLRSYSLQIARRSIVKEMKTGRFGTKHRPYLGNLFALLHAYIGNRTMAPFKIMAMVSILFQLRPEKKECRGCEHWGKGACTITIVTHARCFRNERQALWQMTRRAAKRFPPDFSKRLFDPKNQF